MTIRELLVETQFDTIVFYLNERGYNFPLELLDFDYDELYFVPGVSDESIEQCKEILTKHIKHEYEKTQRHQETVNEKKAPKKQDKDNEKTSAEGLSVLFSDLVTCFTSTIEAIRSRERLNLLRSGFFDNPDYSTRYDSELFLFLCDSIDPLIYKSVGKNVSGANYTPEEYERLSTITVQNLFASAPRGSIMIHYCIENGIKTLLDFENIDFSEIRVKGLGPASIKRFKRIVINKRNAVLSRDSFVQEPQKTVHEHLEEALDRLKERDKSIMLARAQGLTLQEIGQMNDITRERVRQIMIKNVRKLRGSCKVLFKMLANNQPYIYSSDIKTAFNEQTQIDIITYVLKSIDYVYYFPFADKYVISDAVPKDWGKRMKMIAEEVIGDSANYYDRLDLIDERLNSEQLSFLDAIDYMGYLMENGYKAFGDFLVKKSQAYRSICLNVIRRHFQDGIKLDSDENNEDMRRLRDIIQKEFGNIKLPDNNRALAARITPALILCGRGRYISPENTVLDFPLIEQIVNYINEINEAAIYYTEIFSAFSGILLAQTSIDNANYLHGVIKYLYPDEFTYERDLMVKKGMDRVPFENRLAQVIKDNHHPMSKKEIQDKLPGVTDIRIVNAMIRLPEIIQWDFNEYNHIDNLHVEYEDITKLRSLLQRLTDSHFGYCSEKKLFTFVFKEMPEFVKKNKMTNCHNLFYIVSYLLRDNYRFSRPHIASSRFPDIELTIANVARFLLQEKKSISYSDLIEMIKSEGWSEGAFSLIINAVEEDHYRISLNEYILKTDLYVDEDSLNQIKLIVSELLVINGYYGIFSINNYDMFPPISYEWNDFLLQTILERYDLGFRILEPDAKDRRFKRGIIVPNSCLCGSYEEFVIEQLKQDSIQMIAEDEFSSYLRRKGLVLTTNIPQELYEGDGMRMEDGYFVYS